MLADVPQLPMQGPEPRANACKPMRVQATQPHAISCLGWLARGMQSGSSVIQTVKTQMRGNVHMSPEYEFTNG